MADYVCTSCGELFDADGGGGGDGMPCPVCQPMRWGSKVGSPAGRFALHRFHKVSPSNPGGCQHMAQPQGPVLDALGVPDTGAGLKLCPATTARETGLCDFHDPDAPSTPQLDLFSGLFD